MNASRSTTPRTVMTGTWKSNPSPSGMLAFTSAKCLLVPRYSFLYNSLWMCNKRESAVPARCSYRTAPQSSSPASLTHTRRTWATLPGTETMQNSIMTLPGEASASRLRRPQYARPQSSS
ncbi:uncharacterized protein [Palaemon carinicauda]|uniref:uncharacterized protein isoform X1 n=1 Tax=Palaemon carinicauda TaxID=392227 RepID=UPI0035B68DEA